MKWHSVLCLALGLSLLFMANGLAQSQVREPGSTQPRKLEGLFWLTQTQLAFAQDPKPPATKKRKSKAASGSASGMPRGYPVGNGNPNAGSRAAPPGSSMQPPAEYQPSGVPNAGTGKPGTNPPPGSSLSSGMGSLPGYGANGPQTKPGTPPPGSTPGINSGFSGKPTSYPVNGANRAGPPPGSAMGVPNQAYADKVGKANNPPPEPVAQPPKPVKAKPTTLAPAAPPSASRLMSEFKKAYCSNCNKEVTDKDSKCPHCGVAFDEVVNADGTRTFLKPLVSNSGAFSSPNTKIFAVAIGLAISFFAFLISLISVLVKKHGHPGS